MLIRGLRLPDQQFEFRGAGVSKNTVFDNFSTKRMFQEQKIVQPKKSNIYNETKLSQCEGRSQRFTLRNDE